MSCSETRTVAGKMWVCAADHRRGKPHYFVREGRVIVYDRWETSVYNRDVGVRLLASDRQSATSSAVVDVSSAPA